MNGSATKSAICLGCGCLCDDIEVIVERDRISQTINSCALGEKWFGDGILPANVRIDGSPAPLEQALENVTKWLTQTRGRLLVYVADDLSCDAHRLAISLADQLRASIDGITTDTVADGLLAAQRRGRASGTLGELRHRADAVLFWAANPHERYPRFMERFLEAPSLYAASRRLIAVDVGPRLGPPECTERLAISPDDEMDALGTIRAAITGRLIDESIPWVANVLPLAKQLASAKYTGIIFDAEPSDHTVDPALPEALIALTQSLNGPTRAALWALRAGGNRNGFESVLTWQTGYPLAVDFAFGSPRSIANESVAARISRGRFETVLILGNPSSIPPSVARHLQRVRTILIGPHASETTLASEVTIDTGAAAIHEDALVLRMDDVPIQARKVLEHPHSVTATLQRLIEQVSQVEREVSA